MSIYLSSSYALVRLIPSVLSVCSVQSSLSWRLRLYVSRHVVIGIGIGIGGGDGMVRWGLRVWEVGLGWAGIGGFHGICCIRLYVFCGKRNLWK